MFSNLRDTVDRVKGLRLWWDDSDTLRFNKLSNSQWKKFHNVTLYVEKNTVCKSRSTPPCLREIRRW